MESFSKVHTKDEQRNRKPGIGSLLHRTPFVAGGLVCMAVLIGFLAYAQAGFFMSEPSLGPLDQRTEETAPAADLQTEDKKPVLDSQKTLSLPPETSSMPQESPAPSPTCDMRAKARAESKYAEAMAAEAAFHEKNISRINRWSTFLNTISLGIIKDATEEEKARHEQVLLKIKKTYQKSLTLASC